MLFPGKIYHHPPEKAIIFFKNSRGILFRAVPDKGRWFLGKGKTSFHEKRGRNVGFGIFSSPLSAVALCKGGNPFQEKRGIFKVKDSTLSVISTYTGNRAFYFNSARNNCPRSTEESKTNLFPLIFTSLPLARAVSFLTGKPICTVPFKFAGC